MEGNFLEKLHLTPFQVTYGMPITRIYTVFHVLRLGNVYVTKNSRLIGVITEVHLLEMEKKCREKQEAELWSCLKN